jgi:2,3-bisphosphoglycerate-dependent phosphoglycerate mutase
MDTSIEALKKAALASLNDPGKGNKPLPKTNIETPPVLYIFRHCQTEYNLKKIFCGRRNPPLTEKGIEQAKELAEKLKTKKINLFISPAQLRCSQTLEPLQKYFPNIPYEQRTDLFERDYGDLTGKNKEQVMAEYGDQAILWRRGWDNPPPNGESLKTVWETRIKKFCQELEAQMKKEQINVAYCGTNNTVRLIRWYFERMPKEEMLTIESPYADYASYALPTSQVANGLT